MAVTQTRESSSPAPRGPFTYQHLQHLRDRLDERYRCEIIDGELFVSPSPGLSHQRVAASLHLLLGNYVRARRLGEMLFAPLDVIFSDIDVVVPDLLYLTTEQLARAPDRGVEEAPTLVVEILSPSTQRRDRTKKMALYEEMGVPHYWLVHPTARWIEAYERQAERFVQTARATGGEEFRPPLFPGLVVPLGEIWPPSGSRER